MPIVRQKLSPVVDKNSNHGSAESTLRTVICPYRNIKDNKSTFNQPKNYQDYILRRNLRIKDQIQSNLWLVTSTTVNDCEKLILHRITSVQPDHVTIASSKPWILKKQKNGWLTRDASKNCQLEWIGSSKDPKILELLSVMPIENSRPFQSSRGRIVELWPTIF